MGIVVVTSPGSGGGGGVGCRHGVWRRKLINDKSVACCTVSKCWKHREEGEQTENTHAHKKSAWQILVLALGKGLLTRVPGRWFRRGLKAC